MPWIKYMPCKFKKNYSLPWINMKLRHRLKKKESSTKKSLKSGIDTINSKKACKKMHSRLALRGILTKEKNKRADKNQVIDNIEILPLKQDGDLFYDSKARAETLSNQFKCFFYRITRRHS